jgi:hypothetical protein
MLTEKFLETWIPILVPVEYGPNKEVEAGKALLGIYIISADKMEGIKKFWYKDMPEDSRLYGQLVDIGAILALSGKENSNLNKRFVIRLNESQSEASGIFSLAHEVGHLIGILVEDKQHEEDPDEYADRYAFEIVKQVVKDKVLKTKILLEALDNDFVRV